MVSPVGSPAGPAMLVLLTFASKHTIVASQSLHLTPTVDRSINIRISWAYNTSLLSLNHCPHSLCVSMPQMEMSCIGRS